jgi:2-(1,2-epoxy-1,2-dihydrophenyl)acetyl-CoA isomerase
MIWKAVDDEALPAAAEALAQRLARSPAGALAGIKQAFAGAANNTLQAQLDLEARLQGEAGHSADFAEGVRAFQEKRPARYS